MAADSISDEDLTGASRRRMAHPLALATFTVFAGLALVVGGIAIFGQPSDGDPVVQLDLAAPHQASKQVAHAAPPAAPAQNPVTPPQATEGSVQPGQTADAQPMMAPDPSTSVPPDIVPNKIVKAVYAGRALIVDPALIENTADGPLPRIADDGRTPMLAYAPPASTDSRPRIAIVISGLGISAKGTAQAIAGLPPAVTLAFAPYADDVQRWVAQARAQGHEVLIEVPMEPYDFPDSDPGPHTLRAGASEDTNIHKLTWSLTRFTGYAGVTNLLGGRFLADDDALEPVMTFLARRGLMFFDTGSTTRSAAPSVAQEVGAHYVQSYSSIDTIQTGMEIDRRLSDIEARARVTGSAAGSGFLYPVTIDRVAIWAKGLQGRGFVLVPASAIVGAGK